MTQGKNDANLTEEEDKPATETARQNGMMKSMRRILAVIAIASIGTVHAASQQTMTFDGVGPIRLGMSVAEIEQALGSRLDPVNDLLYSNECFVTQRADKSEAEIRYAIVKGRLELIDVWRPEVATAEGVGIGSTAADVRRVYGGRLVVTPAPYFDEGCDTQAVGPSAEECSMHLEADDHHHGIIFSTKGDRVTALHVGLIDALNALEICQ